MSNIQNEFKAVKSFKIYIFKILGWKKFKKSRKTFNLELYLYTCFKRKLYILKVP